MATLAQPPDAQQLNTGEPGNEAGKPVQEGADLTAGDDREQLHPDDHDAAWADAELSEHQAHMPRDYAAYPPTEAESAEYEELLARGLSEHEARATVWPA